MKNKQQKEDYEIEWWKDWLEADILKREELVSKLPIIKNIWDLKNLPEEIRKRTFVMYLNGFFEDLENAVYTKIRNEEKK